MGTSASRIWSELCAIQSDQTRARMIDTLLAAPELVDAAQDAGVYGPTLTWRAAYARGAAVEFPYRKGQAQGQGYNSPQTSIIISPAAKALDYFQESLALLGISETEPLTHDRVKTAFRKQSLRMHPDKGGSKEAFDELTRAFQYLGKILDRVSPKMTPEDAARLTATVTPETATAYRAKSVPIQDGPPVTLSAKKLDMSTFNKLFEENRLPDPNQETGYGDWLKSQGGSDEAAADPRLKGKFSQQVFEDVFREKAMAQKSHAITRRLEPEYIVPVSGTELGGRADNFSAGMGSETQFTDLKQAYGDSATMFQQVADVKVTERSSRSVADAQRIRNQEMSKVDPDEGSRIAAAAAALEERERQRRLRLAKQDTSFEAWSDQMRRRLLVNE